MEEISIEVVSILQHNGGILASQNTKEKFARASFKLAIKALCERKC
jgi:hypothetical protein